MSRIDRSTSIVEIASLVSQALDAAGITAVLSGGAAVSVYSENEYASVDLDFVTSARNVTIAKALEPLGFMHAEGRKELVHPDSDFTVEFPPGPLAFGATVADTMGGAIVDTEFGPLRIVTPTQSVMDRLAHFVAWNDNQAFDQAAMVARRCHVDWAQLERWAEQEGVSASVLDRLRRRVARED